MNTVSSSRKISLEELRVAETLSSKRKIVVFAYDYETNSAICAHMNHETPKLKLQLAKIPVSNLVVYPLKKTLDLVSDEKDPQGDLRACIHYLNHCGLNETHWKTSWGLFAWNDRHAKDGIKVVKQTQSP